MSREQIENYYTKIVPGIDVIEDFFDGLDAAKKQSFLERNRPNYQAIKTKLELLIADRQLSPDYFLFNDERLQIYTKYSFLEWKAFINYFGLAIDIKKPGNLCDSISGEDYKVINIDQEQRLEYLTQTAKVDALFANEYGFGTLSAACTEPRQHSMISSDILTSNTGLCVGEQHFHQTPKLYLIDNMPLFKSKGVAYIFLEHLCHGSQQNFLDAYFETGTMPNELAIFLDYFDKDNGLTGEASFTNVIKAAVENGIRPIAIESTQSQTIYSCLAGDGTSRYLLMNYLMKQYIQKYASGGSKWIAFMGSGHLRKQAGIWGVSDLLQVPSMIINDSDDESVVYAVDNGDGGMRCDVLINMNPQLQLKAMQKSGKKAKHKNGFTKTFAGRSCTSDSALESEAAPTADGSLFAAAPERINNLTELLAYMRQIKDFLTAPQNNRDFFHAWMAKAGAQHLTLLQEFSAALQALLTEPRIYNYILLDEYDESLDPFQRRTPKLEDYLSANRPVYQYLRDNILRLHPVVLAWEEVFAPHREIKKSHTQRSALVAAKPKVLIEDVESWSDNTSRSIKQTAGTSSGEMNGSAEPGSFISDVEFTLESGDECSAEQHEKLKNYLKIISKQSLINRLVVKGEVIEAAAMEKCHSGVVEQSSILKLAIKYFYLAYKEDPSFERNKVNLCLLVDYSWLEFRSRLCAWFASVNKEITPDMLAAYVKLFDILDMVDRQELPDGKKKQMLLHGFLHYLTKYFNQFKQAFPAKLENLIFILNEAYSLELDSNFFAARQQHDILHDDELPLRFPRDSFSQEERIRLLFPLARDVVRASCKNMTDPMYIGRQKRYDDLFQPLIELAEKQRNSSFEKIRNLGLYTTKFIYSLRNLPINSVRIALESDFNLRVHHIDEHPYFGIGSTSRRSIVDNIKVALADELGPIVRDEKKTVTLD